MTKPPSRKERRQAGRTKRTVDRADRHELIAEAYREPVVWLEPTETDQHWRRGAVLFSEDRVDPRMHPEMVRSIGVRTDALMEGVCVCGAKVGLSRQGLLLLPHTIDCDGSDQKILRHWDQHLAELREAP